MSAGKTDKVAQGYRTKQWENSLLWASFEEDKEAQEEAKKRGIIFIDERDDIPEDLAEKMKHREEKKRK